MLTSSKEDGSAPKPRYYHASAVVPSHEQTSVAADANHCLMFVVGGVTQNGVTSDTWSLDLSSLIWTQYKVKIIKACKNIYMTIFLRI